MVNFRFYKKCCLLAILSASSPIYSQEYLKSEKCEFHLWTTNKYNASTRSIFSGGALGGVHQNESARGKIERIMSPDAQISAFRSFDLSNLLGISSPIQLVLNGNRTDISNPKSKSRLTSSSAICYHEVVMDIVGYGEDPVWGKDIAAVFFYRSADPKDRRKMKTDTMAYGIKIKKSLTTDSAADEVEIRDAFSKSIERMFRVRVRREND